MIANRRKKKKGERERKERREEGEEGGKRDAVSPRRGGAPTPVTSPGERWQRRLNALVLKRARGRERGKSAEGRRRRGAWRKGTVAREEQQEDERGGEHVRGTESGWRRRKRKEEAREDRDGRAKERGREGERRRARRGVAMEGLGGGAGGARAGERNEWKSRRDTRERRMILKKRRRRGRCFGCRARLRRKEGERKGSERERERARSEGGGGRG